jgi:type I restriction enzyme M protein
VECDLSVKNPNVPELAGPRTPGEILDEIAALDQESAKLLIRVKDLV